MNELTVIRSIPQVTGQKGDHPCISLRAARSTLAKRRWRGVADNGREFGFDLDRGLPHGCTFFVEDGACYLLEQEPEEILQVAVATVEQAARVAWSLGNLHFGIQVLENVVRVTEDPAVLQLLAREHIAFERVTCVFLPLSASSHHDHPPHAHG